MNGTERDGLLESLAELRRAQPSLRLGQLIASLALVARGDAAGAVMRWPWRIATHYPDPTHGASPVLNSIGPRGLGWKNRPFMREDSPP